jgi:uncharacterized protein (TIGR02271 family)
MVGAATGVGVGALWAIGIAAGLLPAIGPVIAGGLLASVVASAAGGAAVGGIVGALIGLGIPEEEAEFYESEVKAGRTMVTVKAGERHAEAMAILQRHGGFDMRRNAHDTTQTAAMPEVRSTAATRHTPTTPDLAGTQNRFGEPSAARSNRTDRQHGTDQTIQLRQEELHAHKEQRQAGEVRVHKDVVTEHRTLEVPVTREEVVIERHPVHGDQRSSMEGIRPGEEIRVPLKEEQVHIDKTAVVTDEVTIGKRQVQDKKVVSDDVKREELRVEESGRVNVEGSDLPGRRPK